MKALSCAVIIFSVIFTSTTPAESDTKGYFGVNGGTDIGENFYVEGSRIGVAYGRDISTNRYLGNFEIGLTGFNHEFDRTRRAGAMLLTYNYQFMRDNKLISFGWNATLSVVTIAIHNPEALASTAKEAETGKSTQNKNVKKSVKEGISLGIGGGVGLFAQTYITKSISVLLQVGVDAYIPFAQMDSPSGANPYTALHVRYYY